MTNSKAPVWLALLLLALGGSTARAQMDFSLDEGEEAAEEAPEGGEDGGSMDFGSDPDAIPEEGDGSADFGEGDSGDAIGDILSDAGEVDTEREAVPRVTETVEEVYAVQRIYALRLNRLEVTPSAAFTVNDPFVARPAVGLALNYWFTNVLAVGVNALLYQFSDELDESDLNFFTRRNTRLGIPITQWQMGAYLNFTYVPFYGKFSVFNKFIFQYDAYIVGGVGLMRTRPVPVIDSEFRSFDFGNRVAFNIGIGLRIFVTRFLGITLEFRDYAFLERFENLEVDPLNRQDPSTWLDDSPTFTNNITTQIGLTLFFPFTFDYRLPK
ncbi:MAG: outer membrane beta-barrel domain-containing protein [Planctomycetota bacterium]